MKSKAHSFYTSVASFFMQYLDIPETLFETKGILTKTGTQACAKYLIEKGVFINEKDMKTQAFEDYRIILPDWVFEGVILNGQ